MAGKLKKFKPKTRKNIVKRFRSTSPKREELKEILFRKVGLAHRMINKPSRKKNFNRKIKLSKHFSKYKKELNK